MMNLRNTLRSVSKCYIDPGERQEADRKLPGLLFEGLLLGGSGLGVLALIFEIAADAFSVAAYQTLLAIHGAGGYHGIAFLAFSILSVMLFFGVVPAYKAGAYLRPSAGGSGPLIESIGPPRLRFLSWIGTSLFFLDAILTIIISAISAADVTMLLFPEWADYRILLAEGYAFFIMVVLVALGPRRAVPLFLLGGGAFTVFTVFALGLVGYNAVAHPEFASLTGEIVQRLEASGVAEHVVRVTQDVPALGQALFFQLLLRSMSSAMLGFSGYEVIPASGKHAARPKWKVINTALTLAAVFLIGTGLVQLFAAQAWAIPATEGYSTLLIEYEIVIGQTFGVQDTAEAVLAVAGGLLAIILLLAQGGGYVGGAAVAANASRLGRLPRLFADDRNGIVVIWGFAALAIPIIRQVVVVEAYYAFGFVSAFIITSTSVYFARKDVLQKRGIDPGSDEAKSLRFAGLRGMVASYIMGLVLITQKTDALLPIAIAGALITLFQYWLAYGGFRRDAEKEQPYVHQPGAIPHYACGIQRAIDEARQRGIADRANYLLQNGVTLRFNVEPRRLRRLISHMYNIAPKFWTDGDGHEHHNGEHLPEPSPTLEVAYQDACDLEDEILEEIEHRSRYGIFTFIQKYNHNWVSDRRDKESVERAMLRVLFPMTPLEDVWAEYKTYEWIKIQEDVWQFCRKRYQWAKHQWPNLSDPITTMWTLQDLDMLKQDVSVDEVAELIANRMASTADARARRGFG